jgi:hypothetical protein
MTAQQVLNTVGLALSMVGVLIIFRYGPPQPSLEEGVALGLEDGTPLADGRTVAEHNRDVAMLRDKHQRMSKTGLALVFFGFGFQLWATWS